MPSKMIDGSDLGASDGTSPLDFLKAVYCNNDLPLPYRLKAAIAAAPFVHPKLSVSANLGPDSEWVERLERAIERSTRVIEARPQAQSEPIDHTPPVAQTDRRYRR
jgi:hypothetical protein